MLLQIPNTKLHKDPSSNFEEDTGEQTCLPIMHLCHAVCVKDTTTVLSMNQNLCASNSNSLLNFSLEEQLE
jgi:hypothetical protein